MSSSMDRYTEWLQTKREIRGLTGAAPSPQHNAESAFLDAVDAGWSPAAEQFRAVRRAITRCGYADTRTGFDAAARVLAVGGASLIAGLLAGPWITKMAWGGKVSPGPWWGMALFLAFLVTVGCFAVIWRLTALWQAHAVADAHRVLMAQLPGYTPTAAPEPQSPHPAATYWAAALTGVPLCVAGVLAMMFAIIGAPLLFAIWVPVAIVWVLLIRRFDAAATRHRQRTWFRNHGPDIEQIR